MTLSKFRFGVECSYRSEQIMRCKYEKIKNFWELQDVDMVYPTSVIISLLVMLFSGSLQIKRNMHADVPLDEFKAHMDERIPALMKLYGIPGCNTALCGQKSHGLRITGVRMWIAAGR